MTSWIPACLKWELEVTAAIAISDGGLVRGDDSVGWSIRSLFIECHSWVTVESGAVEQKWIFTLLVPTPVGGESSWCRGGLDINDQLII